MKKVLALVMIVMMSLGLFAACGSSEEAAAPAEDFHVDIAPYDTMDLSEYVKVPEDLSGYKLDVQKTEVSDDQVENEIQKRLDNAAETTEIKEGTVDKGDTVNISYKGTLKDGSSPEGMNSDGMDLELGSGQFIEGFEEGLYGAKIGDTVTLDLKFPDPYPNNTELSGQDVTFEVTILSKKESKAAELNEEFIKNDSQGAATTEKEYRAFIKDTLQKQADSDAEYNAKMSLYQQIMGDCEILKYPEEQVEAEKTRLTEQYKSYAESQQIEWEDFVKNQFETEEEFNKQLDEYVREALVGTDMKVYSLCKQEGIEITDEEYSTEMNNILASFNVSSVEEFEKNYGTSFEDYLSAYDVTLNMYVTRLIDKVTGAETQE